MSATTAEIDAIPSAGDDHHDEEHHEVEFLEALNPPPSYWPFLLALVLGVLPTGLLIVLFGGSELMTKVGYGVTAVGFFLALIPTMGWCHSVIVDKWTSHFGVVAQGRDLVLGTKLFFLSEIAIFASLFAYHFVQMYHFSSKGEWPPVGTPLGGHVALPAVGLIILMTSSFTCEIAHKAMMKGKRGLCKDWLMVTMILGLIFLTIQGYEWGLFLQRGFTPTTNNFATSFYVITGFHGIHVMTGLIMLMLCYGRLELGHYNAKRHFSLVAASWYWHLVDVVWIFVLVFVYCFWEL